MKTYNTVVVTDKLQNHKKNEENKVAMKWKEQFTSEHIVRSSAYFKMEKYIEMVCEGFSNFVIIVGEGGLGKTWSSQSILNSKIGNSYVYLNSFTTPLELYNFLYDNANDKVILIDDCEGIWDNTTVSLLKNATEINGKRQICWNSSTTRLNSRNKKCSFDSRIILLSNVLSKKNAHLRALLSRANTCELKFSYEEKIDIISRIAAKPYKEFNLKPAERKEIMDFIKRNTNEITQELSIRTLIKCYHFYKFSKKHWKVLSLDILKTDENMEIVMDLIKSEVPVAEQVKLYSEQTGKSSRDYFRKKEEICNVA